MRSSPSSEHPGHIYIPWGKISLSVFWQLLKHVLSPVYPPKRNFSSSFFKMFFFFLSSNTEISLRLASLKVLSVHIMFLNTRSFHQIQDMKSHHIHLLNLSYRIWMNLRELSCLLLLKMIRVLNTRRSRKACWVTSWVPWDRSQGRHQWPTWHSFAVTAQSWKSCLPAAHHLGSCFQTGRFHSLSLCLFIHVVRPFRMVILRNQIKRAFGSTSPSSTEKHYLNVFSLSFFPFLFFSFEPELWCSLPPPPVEPSLEAANWADWKHLCYLEATVLCMSLHPVVLRY